MLGVLGSILIWWDPDSADDPRLTGRNTCLVPGNGNPRQATTAHDPVKRHKVTVTPYDAVPINGNIKVTVIVPKPSIRCHCLVVAWSSKENSSGSYQLVCSVVGRSSVNNFYKLTQNLSRNNLYEGSFFTDFHF